MENTTHPDTRYTTYQCSFLSEYPGSPRGVTVDDLVCYLAATNNNGIVLYLKIKSLEVFSDANFFGNWYKLTSPEDVITTKSRTGYVIMYIYFPIKSVFEDIEENCFK